MRSLISIAVGALALATSATAQVTFVHQAATGAQNGSSWQDAYTDLQAALAATSQGEIWVARGTYLPGAVGNPSATFQLKSDVALYGGFAGGETSLSQRDVSANPTILSGDIGAAGAQQPRYHLRGFAGVHAQHGRHVFQLGLAHHRTPGRGHLAVDRRLGESTTAREAACSAVGSRENVGELVDAGILPHVQLPIRYRDQGAEREAHPAQNGDGSQDGLRIQASSPQPVPEISAWRSTHAASLSAAEAAGTGPAAPSPDGTSASGAPSPHPEDRAASCRIPSVC